MNTLKLYLQLTRLNKPVGSVLLLWPTLWALWLANHGIPSIRLLIIFILGTFITRSAGCIINDIFDRDFDRHVERTRQRPLASGQLSLTAALILLVIFSGVSFILLLQLNKLSIIIGFIAALIAVCYPLMKRITNFPQIFLGIAFSMGVPMAFAASSNQLPYHCWLLFIIAVLWPIMYDTAYAITDLNDDITIGIKSTAVFFKERSALFIALLQIILILGFILLGIVENLKLSFYMAVTISALLFFYQQYLLKQNKPFAAFLNNQWLGCIIWLGISVSLL
jgi:4-hydroxybenzoate polyprenyltransferase